MSSMHQGLDLSRFKKVSSGKDSSTLKHSKGHTIMIAHSGITPRMREQLDGLPIYMAEGGEAEKPLDPESPATADDDSAPDEAPVAAAPDAAPAAAPDAPPDAAPDAAPNAAPDAAAAPNAGPADDNTVVVTGTKKPQLPPENPVKAELDAKAKAWADDLANQHVDAKTYGKLFHDQGLPGKIGTLFGLLLSGAGAGLAHQQNAVLGMMNKELENDFEAQKTSKSNAQNFLRIAQAHELQEAQIDRYKHENLLTDEQAKNAKLDGDIKATTNALNYVKLAGLQGVKSSFIDRLTPGPTKDAAMAIWPQMQAGVAQDINTRNAQTEAHLNARKALRGDFNPATVDSGVNESKMQNMLQQTAQGQNLGMVSPNGILPADVPLVQDQAGKQKLNRATTAAYVDSFTKLQNAFLANKLNPNMRAALIGSFEQTLAKQVGTNEAHTAVQSMFPDGIKEWGGSAAEKFDKEMEHLKLQESGFDALDRYHLKTPFPNVPNPAKKQAAAAGAAPAGLKEGSQGVDKNKRPWVVRGGKRVYK